MKKRFPVALLLLILAISPAAANIIYVDCNSPNEPGTGTFDDPFRKIQDGINAALTGDTVLIRPGVYTGTGNYNINPNGKSITISGLDPNNADIVANTIINPNGAGRGFYIYSQEDANCIISGLTVTDACTVEGFNGAGIYCYDSSPTIQNCIIKNNRAAEGSGGGICFNYGKATIINCTIKGNIADYYGGGISSMFASPTIIGCTINGNTADLEGGGIDSGASEANIINCIVADNNSLFGGGLNCYFSGLTNVVNCTLAANSADNIGGAVYCWYEAGVILKNTVLWENIAPDNNGAQIGLQEQGTAAVSYCNIQGGQPDIYDPCGLLVWGQSNIDIDPCFAWFDPEGDPNLWDFHLQSTAGRWNTIFYKIDFNNDGIINLVDFALFADKWLQETDLPEDLDYNGLIDLLDLKLFSQNYLANVYDNGWVTDEFSSPCVDAGDPNSDWSNETWPNSKRINIGAYAGTNQASKSGNIADFDVNGLVNFPDLMEFCSKWLNEQGGIVNLDLSGRVNFSDFAVFAQNWLWEKE